MVHMKNHPIDYWSKNSCLCWKSKWSFLIYCINRYVIIVVLLWVWHTILTWSFTHSALLLWCSYLAGVGFISWVFELTGITIQFPSGDICSHSRSHRKEECAVCVCSNRMSELKPAMFLSAVQMNQEVKKWNLPIAANAFNALVVSNLFIYLSV